MTNPVNIQAVAIGANFCSCGGMMVKSSGNLLMSDPPKVEVKCPFCGSTDTVIAPYGVEIQFKELSNDE